MLTKKLLNLKKIQMIKEIKLLVQKTSKNILDLISNIQNLILKLKD